MKEHWIKIENIRPSACESVLLHIKDGGDHTYIAIGFRQDDGGYWINSSEGGRSVNDGLILHWQPLERP